MTRPPKRRLMIIGKEVRINRAKKIKVSIDRLMMARLLQAGLVQLTTNLDYDPIGHFLYLTVDTEALKELTEEFMLPTLQAFDKLWVYTCVKRPLHVTLAYGG